MITRVPSMGGAGIHLCSELSTWSACLPGSCHKMVKHWTKSVMRFKASRMFDTHLPAVTVGEYEKESRR